MRDLLELLGALGLEALEALLARDEVLGVVALVEVDLAVVDLGHAVDHGVHEGAVVADHDDGALVAAQEALEPLDRLQIEVVGGLVEQQHLGVADEQLRERDAHLPAAGELVGGARHVRLGEAQAEQHASHLGLQRVAAHHLVGVPGPPHGRQLRLGGVAAQLGLQLVQALLGLEHLHLAGEHLLEHGQPAHLDGLLLEVAHPGPLGEQDAPLVGVVLARDDVQERRLARAVGPHERQAVVLLQAEGDVVEQLASAVGLREVLGLEDHGALASSWSGPRGGAGPRAWAPRGRGA